MTNATLNPKKLILAILAYLIWVLGYTYYTTQSEKKALYNQLDQQLTTAALTAPLLLPPTFHHQNMKPGDISVQQDAENRQKLSEYTDREAVIYIYTLIRRANNIYFTSSSATPEERESDEGLSYYFDHYDDVDPRVLDVFNSKEKTFIEYTDQWGTFRSVFIPLQAADGSLYLVAADLSISHIAALVNQRSYRSLFVAFVFMILVFPLYRTALHREKVLLKELDSKVHEQTVALERSQTRLKQALHSANQTWFEVNLQTDEITVSDEYQLFGFGNSGDLFSIQQWQENIHPDDRDTTIALFNHAIRTGDSITTEYRVKANEQWIWLQTSAEIVTWDEHNQPLIMVGINNNITEKKVADDKLRESEARLRLSQESGGVGTWEHDFIKDESICSDNVFTKLNLPWTNSMSTWDSVIAIIEADDRILLNQNIHDHIHNGAALDQQFRVTDKNGNLRWMRVTGNIELNSAGNPVKMRSILRDVTDYKYAETELKKYQQHLEELVEERTQEIKIAKDEAERANEAKSEFLSSMNHELRTPMNAILGFSQILKNDKKHPLTPDQMESVDYILQSGEHLLELIDGVLDLSKIETGTAEVVIDDCNVNELVSQVWGLMTPDATNASIELVNKAISKPTVYIKADYNKLKQVLINFASNAIKYNCEQGRVIFDYLILENNKVRLEVSDTGQGADEESFAAMFEPFNRLDMANSSILGTGIGLSICKELVALMDGEIGVFKNNDKGLTFWVEFDQVQISNS